MGSVSYLNLVQNVGGSTFSVYPGRAEVLPCFTTRQVSRPTCCLSIFVTIRFVSCHMAQGDDIVGVSDLLQILRRTSLHATQFNRAMRLKANKHGFSLNQRGLYTGVVRDPRDRQNKICEGRHSETISTGTTSVVRPTRFFFPGNIVASETEEEIFNIMGSCALFCSL